jgi:Asp-tRNA(Asn)/Glu-tRNA(Gln) amidotransferase A subunit family amidase
MRDLLLRTLVALMGVQIIGRHGDESRVLAAARAFEQKFGPRKPPRWHG